MSYEEVLKTHIAVFGKTLARTGMTEAHEAFDQDYVLYLINNEGLRWMLNRYLESDKPFKDAGLLLDKLNEEYIDYQEWVEKSKARKQNKSF
jgi:hypothetical protein